ncbi:hypothetical protein CHGG_09033 [Chaetomium globosum CBS 148.51]|uniref:Extracellular membrane protein CFEM domain-containing protein n=1 Tax=Chaetomium globosum (strain ATCC 6205 / CBS 148.51 / DSM 1962 / NBRC 6347 / NRRL 1970) TaxID=306901 RepID=Q2GSM1_CHAGB|nr:uncharacterized protein CHGG_09033 [Chaetomium globosum CBS 148.51]EAQ85019.1 hypothetical protein CHGG_09033 [Chaetomium globosum CBS 148.51]
MRQTRFSAAVLALAVASARAAEILYVTDMPAYEALSALRYNVQSQTYDACPEAVSELQSCVCTKNNNFASISSQISASVSYSCGSTASEDHASAQSVFKAYCDPSLTVSFPSPTAVSVYITDIPEYDYLAPCAKSAIKYGVGTVTYELCPTNAPALASCACKKNQNSLKISQAINSEAKSSCSGHSMDISSAQAMFAAYCAMNDGTTKFPVPSNPPGDNLPQYSSLAPCAASGLLYAVQSKMDNLCPSGPQALASCVCLKEGMTMDVLRDITSSVKWDCSSTATEDVSSAVAVFDYYCSAAEAKVTAAGVSNSIEQTYPATRATTNGPKQTGNGGNSDSSDDGNGNSGSDGSDGSSQGGDNESSSGSNTGVIVGAVVGVIGGLAVIGAIIFFVLRARRNRPDSLRIPDNANDPPVPLGPYGGKAELASDSVASPRPPSPSPSTLKVGAIPGRVSTVSPVSANTTGAFAPPPNNQAELSGQAAFFPPMPNRPELHNQHTGTPSTLSPNTPELHGQAQAQAQNAMFAAPAPNAPELYGQGAPSANRPELQGQGAMVPPSPHAPELYGQGAPAPNRPELQGQGAMMPPPPNAPELYGQGAPAPNRPELQGQGAMYAATPANMSELQGQGSQYHNANPNRPELAGQYSYPPQQQQQQQQQHQPPYPPQQSPHMQPYSPQQSPYDQQHQYQQQPQQHQYPQQQQHQQQYPSPTPSPHPPQLQPGYHAYSPGTPPPNSGAYGQQQQQQHPQASWQAGPVPDLHEMDGGREGR